MASIFNVVLNEAKSLLFHAKNATFTLFSCPVINGIYHSCFCMIKPPNSSHFLKTLLNYSINTRTCINPLFILIIIFVSIIIIIIITGSYAAVPATFHERHSSGLSIEWISLIIVISGIAVIAVVVISVRYVVRKRRPRRNRHTRHPKLGR